ncbi:MAG: MFS transporter [Sphingomonadaceae bacterium]|nr:MFS transporter [Sphingomonadaceae bacterium]
MSGKFSIGWRQVWLCLILLAASAMVTMTYGIISVPLMKEFEPSRMVLMLTMSVISVSNAVLSPLLGTLMDKASVRLIMFYGAASLSIGYFLLSFVTSFYQVLIVFGVFMAPAQVAIGAMAVTVLLSRWFSAMRGRALGIAISGISLGGFFFPPVAQALLDTFEWREAMRVFALVIALIVLPCVMLVVNRPSERGLHPDGADEDPEHGDPSALVAGLSTRAVLTDSTFWMLALICALVFSGMRGLVTNIAPMAVDEGVDPTLIAYLLSLYAAAGVVAKLGFAWIADRINPRLILFVALVGAGASHGCMVFADQGFAMIAAGAILMGMFGGIVLPLQSFLVPRIFGRNIVGRVSGLLGLAMFVFNFSSPPVFGLTFDIFGNYDVVYAVYSALMVIAMLILPRIRLHPRVDMENPAQAPASVPAQ